MIPIPSIQGGASGSVGPEAHRVVRRYSIQRHVSHAALLPADEIPFLSEPYRPSSGAYMGHHHAKTPLFR